MFEKKESKFFRQKRVNNETLATRADIAMARLFVKIEGIKFIFVPTQIMVADCLTKSVSGKDVFTVLAMDF